ncbi:MAG TPA: type II secretion system F family protein [Rhizomicrobium sp.]|nr:type II secretion system F family protein [Rhizomicrobium sp.]
MLSSPATLLVLAAMAVCMLLGVQQFHRRVLLVRLQGILGVEPDESPFAATRVLQWIGSRIPGASDESLQTALAKAGFFQPSALPIFVALRLVCTIGAFFVVLLKAASIEAATLMLAVFLAFFCSRVFVILLKAKAERRERLLRRELPSVVDLLLMVLNSGISIDQSLRYVAGMLGQTAPLSTIVLKRYVADIDSGMPFDAAFERMGQRFAINEGYDLAHLIKQSLLQGGEIMASLESFGAELADKRVSMAREQIGRKSVMLTMAMLAFFMPVLMITLGGPAVSQIMKTLTTVQHELQSRKVHHR